jgi:hydroxyacylglutathione hydrolase
MKYVNKVGPALLHDLATPVEIERPLLDQALAEGALVFDLRSAAEFVAGHIPGSISVPIRKMYSTCVGWFVDFTKPTYLVVPDDADMEQILKDLRAIGVDDIPGYLPASALGDNLAQLPTATVKDLSAALADRSAVILDMRNLTEYEEIHLPGALHIPLGYLPRHLDEIPRDTPIIAHCATGYRSQVGTSLLRRFGFTNVATLVDPQGTWRELASAVAV